LELWIPGSHSAGTKPAKSRVGSSGRAPRNSQIPSSRCIFTQNSDNPGKRFPEKLVLSYYSWNLKSRIFFARPKKFFWWTARRWR